jgi:hypothetical protein
MRIAVGPTSLSCRTSDGASAASVIPAPGSPS